MQQKELIMLMFSTVVTVEDGCIKEASKLKDIFGVDISTLTDMPSDYFDESSSQHFCFRTRSKGFCRMLRDFIEHYSQAFVIFKLRKSQVECQVESQVSQ